MSYDLYLDASSVDDAIYGDLSPDERRLFAWLTGYGGEAKYTDAEIASKLRLSDQEYSQVRSRLDAHVAEIRRGHGTARKPFGFGYAQAVKVTGVSRLAQRFLKHLLTPEGSDLSGNVRGTGLPSLVGGNVADATHMQAVAHMAVMFAADQVKALAVPGSEGPFLASATVTRVTSEDNKADIYVKLLTVDGQVAELRVPVTTNAARRASEANITRYATLLAGLEGP